MKQSSARLVARISVSVVAALVLVVPAAAKPKGAGSTKSQHGKAVRVAAQCPVEGKAHGMLVKSIARNKSATVEDAQAACDAAVALQNPPEPSPSPSATTSPSPSPTS